MLGAEEAAAGLLAKRPRPPDDGCEACAPPSEDPEVAAVGVEALLDVFRPLKRPPAGGFCLSPPLLKMLPGPPIMLDAPAPAVVF